MAIGTSSNQDEHYTKAGGMSQPARWAMLAAGGAASMAGDPFVPAGGAIQLGTVTQAAHWNTLAVDERGSEVAWHKHVPGGACAGAMTAERMYPSDPLVYQDIHAAAKVGALARLGDNRSFDLRGVWNGYNHARLGSNHDPDGIGAVVVIPAGYDTVWLRVLGDRWNAVHAYFLDNDGQDLGTWAGGLRPSMSPDGSAPDYYQSDGYNRHQWLAIPAGRAGKLALTAKPSTNAEFYISGLAFSKNPWAHAAQPAAAYHWGLNGSEALPWHTNSKTAHAAWLPAAVTTLRVPVIPTGQDKLLYVVTAANLYLAHTAIRVNEQPCERFLATYDNPFARFWNNTADTLHGYYAVRIPATLIPQVGRYLKVQFDRSRQASAVSIAEIGTHDLELSLA